MSGGGTYIWIATCAAGSTFESQDSTGSAAEVSRAKVVRPAGESGHLMLSGGPSADSVSKPSITQTGRFKLPQGLAAHDPEETMITIKPIATEIWQVTVASGVTTHHRVRVTAADLERFAAGLPAEELLRASFLFLLEREPNTSILDSFDLPVIARYFPEYGEEIRKRVRKSG